MAGLTALEAKIQQLVGAFRDARKEGATLKALAEEQAHKLQRLRDERDALRKRIDTLERECRHSRQQMAKLALVRQQTLEAMTRLDTLAQEVRSR